MLLPSVFRPTDLAGLKLWLDANAISGLVDGDPVATWSDLSGNGNHATQATAANRPLFKTNILNGRPVVRFDGTSDSLLASLAQIPQPLTAIVVARFTGGSGWLFDGDTDRCSFLYDIAGVLKRALFAGAAVAYGSSYTLDTWEVESMVFNGASSALYANGVADTLAPANPGFSALRDLRIGARIGGADGFFTGDIAELIIINRALSDAERKRLDRYFSRRYGIALAG